MMFSFDDEPNTAAIICTHILNHHDPILYVSHDEDDGMWQFLCGQIHDIEDAKVVSLKWVFEYDPSISILSNMPCGYYAIRESIDDEWRINRTM